MPFASVRRATRQALASPAGPTLSGLALGAILATNPAVVPAAQAAVCRVPGTYATLQAAVDDTSCTRIQVAAGTYPGTLAITRSMTLLGAGPARTILDGENRGGSVVTIAPGVTVTITGVTIEGGLAKTESSNGGGIYNAGTLTVDNSTLTQNEAFNGGGIFNDQGTLTVTNSTLAENEAFFVGGIYNFGGTVTIDNSTLTQNTAIGCCGVSGLAGGVWNEGIMTITNSTLTQNTAPKGGGIINFDFSTLTIINSTLTANAATAAGGGGIYNFGGTLTVHNSTLTANTATAGGGIYNFGGSVTLTRVTFQGNSLPEWPGARSSGHGCARRTAPRRRGSGDMGGPSACPASAYRGRRAALWTARPRMIAYQPCRRDAGWGDCDTLAALHPRRCTETARFVDTRRAAPS